MVGGASSTEPPTVEAEGRARAERTRNMYRMSVTLDVSRLSGWLNAYAPCPAQRRAIKVGGMWAGRRERLGWWRCEKLAGEGPKGDQGCGARAERTPNMSSMVVTLDVLRLSVWLNADAACPAKRRA